MSLSADPRAFCVNGMFKIFVRKNCQFTGIFTSQYIVKPVKETCETVHSIPKETCQKAIWFDKPYKTACFWGINETSKDVYDLGLYKFVEYFHVFPTS